MAASSCLDWDGVDQTSGHPTLAVLEQEGCWRQTLSKLEEGGSSLSSVTTCPQTGISGMQEIELFMETSKRRDGQFGRE